MARSSLVLGMVLLTAVVAGCTPPAAGPSYDTALDLAVEARDAADDLPDSQVKQAIVKPLDALKTVLTGADEPSPELARVISSQQWVELFGPATCEIGYATRLEDFSGDGKIDGLLVRVRLEDRFGDSTKALGAFRIEAFKYQPRSMEKRGAQLGNWFVAVHNEQDVRRYYDSIDRSFRFPLKFAASPGGGRLIVQATYYVPDGSGDKLFGERVIDVEH